MDIFSHKAQITKCIEYCNDLLYFQVRTDINFLQINKIKINKLLKQDG